MARFKITKRNNGFTVKVMFQNDKKIIKDFNQSITSFETKWNHKLRRTTRQVKEVFATYMPLTNTFSYQIGFYSELIQYLKNNSIPTSEIEVGIETPKEGLPIKIKMRPNMSEKDYQKPIVEFIQSPGTIKVLPLQTGKGKTAISLFSIYKMNVKTAVILAASHVSTWLIDADKFYSNSKKNITVVGGSLQFKNIIQMAKKNKRDYSILIITVNILRNYLTEYEDLGYSTYGCTPDELFDVLGIGFKVCDEAHTNLNFGFRLDALTNVSKTLYLSATMESNDQFKNKLYGIIFPETNKYIGLVWDKYIDTKGIMYNLTYENSKKVVCSTSKGYNHNKYEQWILESEDLTYRYFSMLYRLMQSQFLDSYLTGQKLLVYVSSQNMARQLSEFFIDRLPECLKCTYFIGDSEDEDLYNNDIVITTPNKTGTGKNVYGLTVIICTIAINGMELNKQIPGRLRRIDDLFPGVIPTFIYLVCGNIQKHLDYNIERVKIFEAISKSVKMYKTNYYI